MTQLQLHSTSTNTIKSYHHNLCYNESQNIHEQMKFKHSFVQHIKYCKTLNVHVPFISRISRGRWKHQIKVLIFSKIWSAFLLLMIMVIYEDFVFILQWAIQYCSCCLLQFSTFSMTFEVAKIKGAKIILHVKSPNLRAAELKGSTVLLSKLNIQSYLAGLSANTTKIHKHSKEYPLPVKWGQ